MDTGSFGLPVVCLHSAILPGVPLQGTFPLIKNYRYKTILKYPI